MPERIQLSRKKGWRMPPNTVNVARPTKWGNPERVVLDELRYTGDDDDDGEPIMRGPWVCLGRGSPIPKECGPMQPFDGWWFGTRGEATAKAVEMYRFRLTTSLPTCRLEIADQLDELRGKDLACWCPLDQPCHADVLLELANPSDNQRPVLADVEG